MGMLHLGVSPQGHTSSRVSCIMGEVQTGDVNVGCEDGDRPGGDADTGGGLVDGGGWEWGVPGTQP